MTLLEAVIACVLLSVVGVVCLDQTRGAVRLQEQSVMWSSAVSRAESAFADAATGTPSSARLGGGMGDDSTVTVERRPWRPGVDLVQVRVALPSGGAFDMVRLVPSPRLPTR